MNERIKSWWKLNGLAAAGISKQQWDELDAAIREDERVRYGGVLRGQIAGLRIYGGEHDEEDMLTRDIVLALLPPDRRTK